MTLIASRCALLLASACVVGCTTADVDANVAALGLATRPPAQDELLLDRRADGAALYARVETAVADTDSPRVLVLRTALGDRSLDISLDGARVLDARFAGSAIVTIGEDHLLRAHLAGRATELDTDAEAPLSVAGTIVAYARGSMPSFELARADLASGVVSPWTDGMAPVWSPALSSDGSEVIFVSGATGTPRLYRLGRNGAPVALPEIAHFPSSTRAPQWRAATLYFEDESGTPRELGL